MGWFSPLIIGVVFFLISSGVVLARESIKIQLKGPHSFQFAGYYAAKHRGFYAENGLDVELVSPGPSREEDLKRIEAKTGVYGVGDMGLLPRYAAGEELVWLSQIFQHSPWVIVSMGSSDIHTPHDLIGKKLAKPPMNSANAAMEMMLMESLGPQAEKIEYTPAESNRTNLDDLVSGKVDACIAHLAVLPHWLRNQGYEVNIMDPRSHGIDFYGDNFFTSRKELIEHPGRVERAVEATLKGWAYALENPKELINLILNHYNSGNQSWEQLLLESKIIERMITPELIPLGSIEPRRVQRIFSTYYQLGRLQSPLMPSGLMRAGEISSIDLTPAEKNWLNRNRKIRLVISDIESAGLVNAGAKAPSSVLTQLFSHLSDIIGTDIQLIMESNNTRLHTRVKQDKAHGVAMIRDTAINRNHYRLTRPFFTSEFIVFTQREQGKSINNKTDLRGKKIVIPKGFDGLKTFADGIDQAEIVLAESPKKQLEKLHYHQADAAIGYVTYHPLIRQTLFTDIVVAFEAKEKIQFHMGVTPDNGILISILNKGIKALSTADHKGLAPLIKTQYPGRGAGQLLTRDEKKYLAALNELKYCTGIGWHPFEYLDEVQNYQGIVADYMAHISKGLGIPLRPVIGEKKTKENSCDIKITHEQTVPEGWMHTRTIFSAPCVFAVPLDAPLVTDFHGIISKRIGVVKNSPVLPLLLQEYPDLDPIFFPDLDSVLAGLAKGDLDAVVGTMAGISHTIQHQALYSLKIGGAVPVSVPFSMLVPKGRHELLSILNKSIQGISRQEHLALTDAWVRVTYEKGMDLKVLAAIGGGIALIALFFFYRHVLIQRANSALRETQQLLEKQNKELNRLSMTDPLTGLLNRRAMVEHISQEMGQSKRNRSPLSMLILDLDQFKAINDEHGHAVGDAVLENVGNLLKKTVRQGDSIARWGGEEFLVLTPNTKARNALALAEKLRRLVRNLKHGELSGISTSIGLAQLHPMESFDSWYERADEALYQAKAQGRDKSICNWSRKSSKSSTTESEQKKNILRLAWNDDFSSGHHEIDSQHVALFDLGNQLVTAVLRERNRDQINTLLDTFSRMSREHFAFEEEVMGQNQCPDLPKHIREHKRLTSRLGRLINRYRRGGLASFILLQFITQELLYGHLVKTDREYFTWFQV